MGDYNFTQNQQLYCLSMVSMAAGRVIGTSTKIQAALQSALLQHLPEITPAALHNDEPQDVWSLTWGPAVYKIEPHNPFSAALNAWFVAVNPKQQMCVVSVAGTALLSAKAWIEDADVGTIVDFGQWSSQWTTSGAPSFTTTTYQPGDSRNLCSRGTCTFTQNILTTVSPSNGMAPGTLLGAYLKDFQSQSQTSNYSIVFAGHSMGGAVAPALALGLVNSNVISGTNVMVLPSAGDTPGNDIFASQFASTFPANQYYNFDYYNKNDIVPQAWSVNPNDDRSLNNVPVIYDQVGKEVHFELGSLIDVAKDKAEKGMPYTPIPGMSFTGPAVPAGIETDLALLTEVGTQHGEAYWNQMGITAFVATYRHTLVQQPEVKEAPLAAAVDRGTH